MKLTRKEINKVRHFINAAFPNYKGFKVSLNFTEKPIECASYWDGGSKDSFVLLHSSGARKELPRPSFTQIATGNHPTWIPKPDELLVEHSMFCGKDVGITLHFHKSLEPMFLTKED